MHLIQVLARLPVGRLAEVEDVDGVEITVVLTAMRTSRRNRPDLMTISKRQLEERMANGLSLLTVPAESHSRKENNKTRPDQRNPVVLRVVTRLKISQLLPLVSRE